MTDIDKQLIDNFLADLADNEWIIDDPYSPDMVEMPLFQLEQKLKNLVSQAKAEQREIDAGIVDSFGFANKTLEEKHNELIGNVEIDREGDSYKNGFNQASKVIATAIRQE